MMALRYSDLGTTLFWTNLMKQSMSFHTEIEENTIKSVIWIISLEFIKMSLSLYLKDRISYFQNV